MTTTAPMSTGRERTVTYLPSELDQRLRTWAALLGLPTSHLLARVITEATPSRDQLAEMVQANATAITGDIPQPPGDRSNQSVTRRAGRSAPTPARL